MAWRAVLGALSPGVVLQAFSLGGLCRGAGEVPILADQEACAEGVAPSCGVAGLQPGWLLEPEGLEHLNPGALAPGAKHRLLPA
jgi:hypothetical protein